MQGVLAIIKALSDAKIPSLLLVTLIFIIGAWLLLNSTNNVNAAIAGGGLILLGAILSTVTFVDFRSKEHIEYLLKQYQAALESIGRTHSTFEKKEQTNLSATNGNEIGEKGEYSVDALPGTPTR